MENETTITVTKETRNRLNKMKYNLGSSTQEDTLNRIIDIVEKIELNKPEEKHGT